MALDYRMKMGYKPRPDVESIFIDITPLVEQGLLTFYFDLAEKNDKLPKTQDAKKLLDSILPELTGEDQW